MTASLFLYIGIFASLMLSARSGEFEFTIVVEPGRFQCFFQTVTEKHKYLEYEYQVLSGSDLTINVMLNLGANTIHQESMQSEGSHTLEIKEVGDYQLCFDNSFSYREEKIVFFEIYLLDENKNIQEDDVTKFASADPALTETLTQIGMTIEQFQKSFTAIKNNVNKIEHYQTQVRSADTRDRTHMTLNSSRVYFWAVLNTVVLIGVAVLQVYMIRSLFEDSMVGKALRR